MPRSANRVFVSAAAIAALVPAVIVVRTMFWKSKPRDTVIHEQAFRVTLPGQWRQQASPDPSQWVYKGDKAEQLTISIFGFAGGTSANERSKLFERLVEMRKRAETTLPGLTAVTTTETTFAESGGILAARYGGDQPAVRRRFACLMLGSSLAFTVFYYESVDSTAAEFEVRGRAIMNSIIVPR